MYAMNIQNDVIRFWNVGQANCILEYFENMMIDHSDSTKWTILPGKYMQVLSISHKMADYFAIQFAWPTFQKRS
jgi:hypothetical protein